MKKIQKFGKSFTSASKYFYRRLSESDSNFRKEKDHKRLLLNSNFKNKQICILCENKLSLKCKVNTRFKEAFVCSNCSHFQVIQNLTPDYPFDQIKDINYEDSYPEIDSKSFNKRVNDLYKPKLDFLIEVLDAFKIKNKYLKLKWYEFGCGAGYFMKACQENNINIYGEDSDQGLINIANKNKVRNCFHSNHSLEKINQKTESILCSFFTFEHIQSPKYLWNLLSKVKPGTIIYFSVPLFGFSTLYDCASTNHPTRHFDAYMHIQLYTLNSLDYIKKNYEFETLGEWYFGQDFEDVLLSIMKPQKNYFENIYLKKLLDNFKNSIDDFQQILNKEEIADSVHLVWKKI